MCCSAHYTIENKRFQRKEQLLWKNLNGMVLNGWILILTDAEPFWLYPLIHILKANGA